MKGNNSHKLGVVVLNYNDYDNLTRYVNEIRKYDCISKIVVVDNSMNDEKFKTIVGLQDNKVSVIKTNENGGYAKGNNIGIKYLTDNCKDVEFIAISNPDVEVSKESYEKCIDFLINADSKVAAVAPRMYDANDNPHVLSGWQIRTLKGDTMDSSVLITRKFNKPHIEIYPQDYLAQDVAYVACLAGSFFIIRKNVFEEIGYFDENTFLYYEEDIIGKKLLDRGYKAAVLNTCKFKHYEAVSVKRTMNYLKKYKIMQKSKRYYHKVYNHRPFYKLWILDLVTLLGILEIYYENYCKGKFTRLKWKIKAFLGKFNIINFVKVLIYLYTIITWPIYMAVKKLRKKKHVLYYSIVTWKWIKQRPHFIPLEIYKTGNYTVDYRYQTLRDKFMGQVNFDVVNNNVEEQKGFRIIPFKIFPGTPEFFKKDKIINLVKTSLWNYDTMILTQPNQIDIFMLNIHKLRRTKIIYECMDNYECWEIDKEGYRAREQKLIYYSQHIVVTAEKLKERIQKLYGVIDNCITIIRNAYDKELFKKETRDIPELKHPNVVYIGTIDKWFDFDSIVSYAKNHKEQNIYIIGPVSHELTDKVEKIKLDNVMFPGSIEHDSVPSYIQSSDVLIMPFILNELIKSVDPVKLYEYLYFKKAVVASYWTELDQFKNMMYFYDYNKKGDFERALNEATKNGFRESEDYEKNILTATWEDRVKEYVKYL